MKKLFIAASLIGATFFTSCKKETETIVETQNETIVLTLEPFEQIYYGSSVGYGGATVDYTANNQGDKEVSSIEVKFEAITDDGSVYTGSDYIFNLEVGDNVSSQVYINVADKECKSVKVKQVEITTY